MSEDVRHVSYGWGAPKLIEQMCYVSALAELSTEDIERFQKDADAVSWLLARGILVSSQMKPSYDRITKKIERAIFSARKAQR